MGPWYCVRRWATSSIDETVTNISVSIVFDYGNDIDDLVGAEFWATQLERPDENHHFRQSLTKQGHSRAGDGMDTSIFDKSRQKG